MTDSHYRCCFAVIFLWSVLAPGWLSGAPQERISPKDGAVQVFVPGGEFVMGADDPEAPLADEQRPPHPVTLTAFWMDRHEITNGQFAGFLNALVAGEGKQWNDRQVYETVYGYVMVEHPLCGLTLNLSQRTVSVKPGQEKFPVMPVRWAGAAAYAAAMARRLPTEAEWEYAARGTDGRRYPWGDTWNPEWANVHTGRLAAVGAFPRDVSPFGIMDMGGNVREWVQDLFNMNYYASSPKENPLNNGQGGERVMRGGSYAFTEWDARTTSRYYGVMADGIPPAVGFRTVENAKP